MAVMAGILMGGAMKPDLGGDERPQGPQLFAGWSGVRSTGPFDDGLGFARYQGDVPDYVIGTDWRLAYAAPMQEIAYEPRQTPDYYEQAVAERPKYQVQPSQEAPAEEPLYPSMKGGATYAGDHARDAAERAPAPREQPQPKFDEDAPPEATGDTTRVHG